MTTQNEHCLNCEFSVSQTLEGPDGKIQIGATVYSCRRLPPVPILIPGPPYAGQATVTLVSYFPVVTKEIICAEYQPGEDITEPPAAANN